MREGEKNSQGERESDGEIAQKPPASKGPRHEQEHAGRRDDESGRAQQSCLERHGRGDHEQ
jgi:hypothetical protein